MTAPLVFLHLPKTAGTTFVRVLARQFRPDEVRYLRSATYDEDVRALAAAPAKERERIRLLSGHQVFGLHRHLAPGARYLTIVRHPVSRVVSHYAYVRRVDHPMFVDALRGGEASLLDYATSGASGELENGQVRWLAGVEDDRPLDGTDLDRALRHVDEHFAWVGLTEHFDESLVELAARLRWPRVHYRHRNVGGSDRPGLDDRTRDAILERNQLDLRLHGLMTQRFHDVPAWRRVARRAAATVLRGGAAWAGRRA